MIGSHLDTKVNDGRFDGILGVLAGLALVRSLDDIDHVAKQPKSRRPVRFAARRHIPEARARSGPRLPADAESPT